MPRAVSSTTTRLIDAGAEIMGEPDPDELAFLHVVLAQCSLPYREPAAGSRDYIRDNGRASLIVTAGHLFDPQTRRPQLQGIPYGAKPRLLMIHLCTEAVRRQSATIPIADSMSAFMRELGLSVTGGAKGTIGRFKEQLNRLAAARLQIILDLGDRAATINPAPMIQRFDVWFPPDHRQRVLWPSEVVLSAEFFDSLTGHALPLDPRAIQALQHSARALDIYTWLTHRLPRVRSRNGDRVSWAALQAQFGPDQTDAKTFRRKFLTAMHQVLAAYPAAKVEQVDGGLLLRRSAPPIKRLSPSSGG
ncbi:MAG TPA: replication protein RepA [Stellaceae bacterium]|nr:replication protein RepA [Stellaceae bacterium]